MSTNGNAGRIDFTRAFAGAGAPTADQASQTERVPANFWLNIGYEIDMAYSDGSKETKFVSLPLGVPLDNMKPVKVRGNDPEFVQLQQAQNTLLEQMLAAANGLKPGEAQILNLQIQLRRVSEDKPSTVSTTENVFLQGMPTLVRQPVAE